MIPFVLQQIEIYNPANFLVLMSIYRLELRVAMPSQFLWLKNCRITWKCQISVFEGYFFQVLLKLKHEVAIILLLI